jgi:hypothetical protein
MSACLTVMSSVYCKGIFAIHRLLKKGRDQAYDMALHITYCNSFGFIPSCAYAHDGGSCLIQGLADQLIEAEEATIDRKREPCKCCDAASMARWLDGPTERHRLGKYMPIGLDSNQKGDDLYVVDGLHSPWERSLLLSTFTRFRL